MATVRTEKLPVETSEDVVRVRQAVRAWAVELGFSLVDQTKIVTAASELARNTRGARRRRHLRAGEPAGGPTGAACG